MTFKKEPLIFMSAIGLVGYAVFHGHRLNKDCWICSGRGIIFLSSSVALGGYLAFQED
jgi:hypothetical protein